MLQSQCLLPDCERPLQERLSLFILLLGIIEQSQISDRCRYIGMIWPQESLYTGRCSFHELFRLLKLTLSIVKPCHVTHDCQHRCVLGSEELFIDLQGAAIERLGLPILALSLVDSRQVAELPCCVWVLWSERPLTDRQRLLKE